MFQRIRLGILLTSSDLNDAMCESKYHLSYKTSCIRKICTLGESLEEHVTLFFPPFLSFFLLHFSIRHGFCHPCRAIFLHSPSQNTIFKIGRHANFCQIKLIGSHGYHVSYTIPQCRYFLYILSKNILYGRIYVVLLKKCPPTHFSFE